jgi:RimJ/RimL family protein N-acetyltransferase
VLRTISEASAAATLAGQLPPDVTVAEDFPTEFSAGVARNVGKASPLGPFFIHRAVDDVVVGEIGGGFVAAGTVEIGYAVVASVWGQGFATDHTPVDRPASGRVLTKAGFTLIGETDDEHDGVPIRVYRWELRLAPDHPGQTWPE